MRRPGGGGAGPWGSGAGFPGAPGRGSHCTPGRAWAAQPRSQGRRCVRWAAAGAEVTVPAPGRSPGREGRGQAGGKELAACAAFGGRKGGAGAGRGRRRGRDPLAQRPPCTPSRAAAAARPQPTWPKLLGVPRLTVEGAVLRPTAGPEPVLRTPGLPSLWRGLRTRLRSRPSAGSRAPPGGSPCRCRPGRATRLPRGLPQRSGCGRRFGGIPGARCAGAQMQSPVQRPERPAR